MRMHHYIKNLFVFAPLLFSQYYTETNITHSIYAFIAFSFLASSIYIFNDLLDLEEDRNHPRKKGSEKSSSTKNRKQTTQNSNKKKSAPKENKSLFGKVKSIFKSK